MQSWLASSGDRGINVSAIVDLYELSPMQQGMLFHTLQAAGSDRIHFIQISYTIDGKLNEWAFAESWRRVLDRHAALRTAFIWEEIEKPLQVVYQQVALPLTEYDWRDLPAAEQLQALRDILAADRDRGFRLDEAPLWRLAIIRLKEDRYRVILSFHHIIIEGWSASIIHNEVLTFYGDLCRGRSAHLPTPRPYRDYIIWLQGQDSAEEESFWRSTLSGFNTPTALGVDQTSTTGATKTTGYREARARLPIETVNASQEFARDRRLTFSMLLQGVWALLLGFYSGESDVLFGTVVSGRQAAPIGAESIVGLFINTLPTRARILPEDTSGAWLTQLQLQQWEMLRYEYSSLLQIQGWSEIHRGTPLFESLFIVENWVGDGSLRGRHPDLEISEIDQFDGGPGYPLAIVVEPARKYQVRAIYDRSRFDETTMLRMLKHFQVILQRLIAVSEIRLGELSPLTESERFQMLVEWNDTHTEQLWRGGLARLFESQVERQANAVAVVFGDDHLTYRVLSQRANQVAGTLIQLGAGPEVRVGLCLERSLEMMIALVGIVKTGSAYVPLDSQYPLERLAFIMEDAQLSLTITRSAELDKLPSSWGQMICLDDDEFAIAQQSDEPIAPDCDPDHVVFVSFTSGSTGCPKGVEVRQAGVVRLVMESQFAVLNEEQRLLHLSPPTFDASTFEIWGALLQGGCCVLLTERVPTVEGLKRLISEQRITTLWLTASLFNLVVDEAPEALANVSQVLAGGEALSAVHVQKALQQLTSLVLINGYGPTEATTFTCCYAVPREMDHQTNVPIGRPIGQTQIYLLDDQWRMVPVGAIGELHIGGEGLARGYLNRPELTSEKFIPDSFGGREGARLYCTGDLVRSYPDGRIEYLGRKDRQVKVRGYRIEPGEIEAALAVYPGVQQALVTVREDPPGDKRLVAYLVAESDCDCTLGQVRAFLQRQLPDYLLPAACVRLNALPLQANGKVDRGALPAPNLTGSERISVNFAAPTLVEELLAQIWGQILGIEAAGPEDNFFDLGGHSLLATQAISRIREVYGVEISLRQFFIAPTLAGLAAIIEQAKTEKIGDARPPIERLGRETAPLSYAQQRLWLLEAMISEHALYLIPVALRIDGALQVAAFEQSFDEVARRHETLRTRIVSVEEVPVQVIDSGLRSGLLMVDLSGLDVEDKVRQTRNLSERQARRPIALEQGPMLRLALLRCDHSRHIAVIVMHHIITDGWSNGVLVEEVNQLYRAYRNGRPSTLAELKIQYADYAVWQRQWLQGDVLQEQLAYWRGQLQQAPRVLELPADYSRPPHPTSAGARQMTVLPAHLVSALKQLARSEGVTLFMMLMAGLQALLHRYSGQEDLCVGAPIGNRNQSEIEGLIGFFVNTLVIRTQLKPDTSFIDLLKRVREAALGAYLHQDLPFEYLVESIQPERALNRTPLFQVVLAVQNAPARDWELDELKISQLSLGTETAKFDLTFDIRESADELKTVVEYSTELFSAPRIARLLGHFTVLLESITSAAQSRLCDLRLITKEEERILLGEWNDSHRDYPRNESITRLLKIQAKLTPHAVAVVDGDLQVTYERLNLSANRLAGRLQRLGVVEGTLIGLFCERSIDMIIGMLGILEAGGAFLPLDIHYPVERLNRMILDSGVSIILTQKRFESMPHLAGVSRFNLDDCPADEEAPFRAPSLSGDHQAYVMYTSGSTGRPKGVGVPHRGVIRLVKNSNFAHLTSDAVFLQLAPISFDASTLEIWGSLLNGARLVLYPETELSLEELGGVLRQYQVSILWLTSGLFQQMVESQRQELQTVRQLLAGGDVLSVAHVRQLIREPGAGQLINGYGPTENTTFTCYYRFTSDEAIGVSAPIGRPVANTQVYLLDRNLQPSPIGVPGELYGGGDGLAWGYLGQPGLTAEKFIPNPFSEAPGLRLYRTGDLARYRDDGVIEFLGRLDYQTKIRGFRVEPEEIACALREHPRVRAALVVLRCNQAGDKYLDAYLVPKDSNLDQHQLREYLREKLPTWMIPASFVLIEQLPLTPQGKVDRQALPKPEFERIVEDYQAPRTIIEELLVGIWQRVLDRDRIGIGDNFFELGGHSLLATQVISRIRESLKVDVPLRWLFEWPTIGDFAQRVESVRRIGSSSAIPNLSPVERDRDLPLSFAQQRLWVLTKVMPELTVYNIPTTARLAGQLNLKTIEQGFAEIVRRHEVLRTRFIATADQARQLIEPPASVSIPLIDLSALPQAVQDDTLRKLAGQEQQRLFDLNRGPLFRVTLVRLGGEEHVVLLLMHHIVTDGWSTGVLVRELSELYQAFRDGRPSPLPELVIQYADYAVWQRSWIKEEVMESLLSYWREHLSRAPQQLKLNIERNSKPRSTIRCASRHFKVSKNLCDELSALSSDEGVTLFMTLLAAWQTLLYRYTGHERIPVGVPVANRNQTGIEGLIGFFVNLLVLCTEMQGDPTFSVLLKRVREVALSAYAHQDVPFEQLVKDLRPDRLIGHAPLVQVTFTFQNAPMAPLQLSQVRLTPVELNNPTVEYDLSLLMREEPSGLSGLLIYNIESFAETHISRLLDHFLAILEQVAADPDIHLLDLNLPDQEESDDSSSNLHARDDSDEFFFESRSLTTH